MFRRSIMVKFFTQSCPRCLSGPSSDAKCLCFVKGYLIPTRNYVEGGDKKKDPEKEEPKEPGSSMTNPEKRNEEFQFIEKTRKALEELKDEFQRKDPPRKE